MTTETVTEAAVEGKPSFQGKPPWLDFELDDEFVDGYRALMPPFGGNGLSEATFYRTYSRSDNPRLPELPGEAERESDPFARRRAMESWTDACRRVIEGMHTVEMAHCLSAGINYNMDKAARAAQEAFDLLWNIRWTPPGRGLEQMGTRFIHERGEVEALQNCAFLTTADVDRVYGQPFARLMSKSMVGVGVGFDTDGAGKVMVRRPSHGTYTYVVPDSREGWAESVNLLITSWLRPNSPVMSFDRSLVRPKGALIRGMGGHASGPESLEALHERIVAGFEAIEGQPLTSRVIVDMMNQIGDCVISGNTRRSAEIALGSDDDPVFLQLKDYERYPERAAWGYLSNNSIKARVSDDPDYYLPFTEVTWRNGEPGFVFMENVHQYGRMNKVIDVRDAKAKGFNPCGEQPLEPDEMCTLVELYLPRLETEEQTRLAIKHAYRYAKIVTIMNRQIKDERSREVMLRNNRIGLSTTGITQRLGMEGGDLARLGHILNGMYAHVDRYDGLYSQWYGVPLSIRTTSVKPSGTVALLPMVTPGIHYAVAGRYHIRRETMRAGSRLGMKLMELGYKVEDYQYTDDTWVVEFPVDMGPGVRGEDEVSVEEQMLLHAVVARNWSTNSTSQTVKFWRQKTSARDLAELLARYSGRIKAISFLPAEPGLYAQAPYEAITKKEYWERLARIKAPFHLEGQVMEDLHERDPKFCDGDTCDIVAFRLLAEAEAPSDG